MLQRFSILFFALFTVLTVVKAEAVDVSTLLNKYKQNSLTPNSRQVFTSLGAQVDALRLQNPKALQSPTGQELMQRYAHSINYFAIEKVLSGCKGDEKIKTAILNQAGTVDFKEINCGLISHTSLSELHDFEKISKDIDDKMKGQDARKMQLQIVEEDLKITTASIAHLRHSYDRDVEPEKIVSEICKVYSPYKPCDDALKKKLLDHTKNYANEIKSKEPKYTYNQAAKELNDSFQRLQKIIPNASKGIPESEVHVKLEELSASFIEESKRGPGLLLATRHIRDRAGYIQSPDQGKVKKEAGKPVYTFKAFEAVTEKDARIAVDEAEKSFKMHAGQTMKSLATEEPEYLQKLLIQSPIAVARVLMKQPEYAGVVCDLLKKLAAEKERTAKVDQAMIWGGYIATGVSVVGGTAGMTAGWLVRGTAAASRVAILGSTTSAIGTAASAIPVGYSTLRALDHANESALFEAAFLSGTADGSAMDAAKKSLEEFNKAKSAAIESLGFSVAGFGVAKVAQGLFAAKGLSAAEKTSGLNKVTEALTKLMGDSKTVNLLKTVQGKFSESELGTLVGHLASMTEATRIKALKALEKFGPEKFKQIFTEALEHAAKKC